MLHDVSLAVRPGELVAIVGESGAGKTTLLEALAGVRLADSGRVLFDGADVYDNLESFRTVLGYVPQDDIIHLELPLERTLRYAARLRLPAEASRADVDAAVRDAISELDLAAQADVRVGSLSGGQRKRASIAVELLTKPHVFFLDEPTSGLDPATGAELLRVLRRLTEVGSTVVFTTHAVQDLSRCDRIVFLAGDGHLAFAGTLEDALLHFDTRSVEEIYERLTNERTPREWAEQHERVARRGDRGAATDPDGGAADAGSAHERRRRPGFVRQWAVLTQRTFETLARNRLTMTILLGAPRSRQSTR